MRFFEKTVTESNSASHINLKIRVAEGLDHDTKIPLLAHK